MNIAEMRVAFEAMKVQIDRLVTLVQDGKVAEAGQVAKELQIDVRNHVEAVEADLANEPNEEIVAITRSLCDTYRERIIRSLKPISEFCWRRA